MHCRRCAKQIPCPGWSGLCPLERSRAELSTILNLTSNFNFTAFPSLTNIVRSTSALRRISWPPLHPLRPLSFECRPSYLILKQLQVELCSRVLSKPGQSFSQTSSYGCNTAHKILEVVHYTRVASVVFLHYLLTKYTYLSTSSALVGSAFLLHAFVKVLLAHLNSS